MSDFPSAVQRKIRLRSRGICEGCGLASATEMHHCQFRSRRGPSTASNSLHLCGWGNHTGCHGVAHDGKKAEEIGWSIRSGHDPREVPKLIVLDFVKVWALFDDDGGRRIITADDALERLVNIGARAAVCDQ